MTTYIITASLDNGAPGSVILFESESLPQVSEVYEKLRRLNDLQSPTTRALLKEFNGLQDEIEDKYGVLLVHPEEKSSAFEMYWELEGIFTKEEVKR